MLRAEVRYTMVMERFVGTVRFLQTLTVEAVFANGQNFPSEWVFRRASCVNGGPSSPVGKPEVFAMPHQARERVKRITTRAFSPSGNFKEFAETGFCDFRPEEAEAWREARKARKEAVDSTLPHNADFIEGQRKADRAAVFQRAQTALAQSSAD